MKEAVFVSRTHHIIAVWKWCGEKGEIDVAGTETYKRASDRRTVERVHALHVLSQVFLATVYD